MTQSADKFLDLLQERKLLPQNMIDGLRRQITESPEEIKAHHVAKLLQRKGKITAFQARELLAEVSGEAAEATELPEGPSQAEGNSPTAAPGDELTFAEDEEEARQRRRMQITPSSPDKERPTPKAPANAPTLDEPASPGGGIDDLLDDPLLQSEIAGPDPLLLVPKKKGWGIFGGSQRRGKRQAAGWDSPLIIVGGGILLLLLLIGGALAFVLTRGSGDEMFAAAEQDYLDGAYAQAISKFEQFGSRHGSHPKASLARVRIGLAKMRIASAEGNWTRALEKSQAVLPTIEAEPAFDLARAELAALLPQIAHGFAEQAVASDDLQAAAATIEKFHQAMELIDNPAYLPASHRASQSARLTKSAEQIALVVRRIEEQSRLTKTIATIESLVADGDPMAAFTERDALLASYPRLHDHPSLVAAVAEISAGLAQHVSMSNERIEATTDERPSPVIAEIAPARASGNRVDALSGHVAATVIDGVLYALSADEGLLLWRRFVGRNTHTVMAVDASAGADLLVIDSEHHDLLRLQSEDGELVWRLPVGKPLDVGRGDDGKLLLTIHEGQLWEVDADSGNCSRQTQFPQPLSTAAVLSEGGRVYLVGDHSSIYVLDSESMRCRGVFHLGHQRGTISHPPVAIAGMLIVAHDATLRRSLLHVLREIDEAPLLKVAQRPLSIEGQFASPLMQSQLGLATVALDGELSLLAIDPAEETAPLAIVANKSGGSTKGIAHLAVSDDYLLMAHDGLAAYRMATAEGALAPRWINHKGDSFVGSLRVIGEHVIHSRRRPNQAGVVIAATPRDAANARDAGRPAWETIVAPGALKSGMTISDDGTRLAAHCATGDVFELLSNAGTSYALNAPSAAASEPGDYAALLRLPGDRDMLVGPGQAMRIAGEALPWGNVSAAALAGADFFRAATWRGGLLVPTSLGQVIYLPASPQANRLHPFQPRLVIGDIPDWLRPMPVGDDQFVVANHAGDVYLVGVEQEGAPHLAAVAQTRLPNPPVAAGLLPNGAAFFVTRGERHDALQRVELPGLEVLDETPLPGRLRWGPYEIDDLLLLVTLPGGLLAYASDATQVWSHDLPGQVPIGAPIAEDEHWTLATTAGTVMQVQRSDGKLSSQAVLAQPLADGPLVWGEHIALRATDGSILLIANE